MSLLLSVGSFFLGGHKRSFPRCIGQPFIGGVPVPDQNLDYLEQQRDIVLMEEFQRLEKFTSSFIFDKKLQPGGRNFINCRHSLTQEKITDRDGERFAYLYQDIQRRERTFAMMITDLNMPGMNGLELARKAREIAPDMPIAMSTGDKSPKICRLAKEAGIVEVFAKPFNFEKIAAICNGIISSPVL